MEIRCGGSITDGAVAKFFLTLSIIYLKMPITDNCIPEIRKMYLNGIKRLCSYYYWAEDFKRNGTADTVGSNKSDNEELKYSLIEQDNLL
jgi:hypothetical protein